MNFINTLAWWQWAALAAVPPLIVLLYFLKLKRQPLEVPSTYLWTRTIEDLHVNTIWQRLRRNLLLLLQLLVVVALMLALTRPGWQGTELSDERFVFLIDNSASMSATDTQPTRLAAAKQQIVGLIDQMEAGHSAMVIAFSNRAQVVQTYTQSRRALRRQVEKIGWTSRPTDMSDALRAASGLANPGLTRLENDQAVDEALPATVYIFSDGGFPPIDQFSLGNITPIYIPVGSDDVGNVGIVAFSTDRNPEQPERLQAFASVVNTGTEDVNVLLELFVNDASVDLVELEIPANSDNGWYFDLPDLEEAVLKAVVHHEDPLTLDNVAYSAVNRPRPARVLVVTPGDESLQVALGTEQVQELAQITIVAPEVLSKAEHQALMAAGAYDLVIYDRCRPQELPQSNTLFIGELPPGDTWNWSDADSPPVIIDVDQVHPLTQLVDMNYVKIAEGRKLLPPTGSSVLFDSVIGPIFAIGPRDGFEDAVLGFPLLASDDGEVVPNTTWPLRPSFPVFVYNVVRYLGGSRGSFGVTNVQPGQPVTLRSTSFADVLTVVAPNGQSHKVQRGGNNTFVFTSTDQPGVYEVRHEGMEFTQRFAVNLFDPEESQLTPRESIELGPEAVGGSPGLQVTRNELWKGLLLVAFVILMLEWYIYNRRLYL